jgi:hypothetical protein
MKLSDFKFVFVAVGLIGILLISSPALADLINLPGGEKFSELYMLGPEHLASGYPLNVAISQNYSVYVDVGNHLSSSTYYLLYVKLGNQTEVLPDVDSGVPSSLPSLFEYRFLVQDGQTYEVPLKFSVPEASIDANEFSIKSLTINGERFNVDKTNLLNSNSTVFPFRLIVELWIYNAQSSSFGYHNRFVYLPFNLTSSTIT